MSEYDDDNLFDDDDETVVVIIGTATGVAAPEPPAWHAGIPEDASITVTIHPILAEAVRDGIDSNASELVHNFSSSGEKVVDAREAAGLIVQLHQVAQYQTVVLSVRPLAAGGHIIKLLSNALWTQVYPDEYKVNAIQTIEEKMGADGLLRHLEFYGLDAEDIIPYRKGLEFFPDDEDTFVPEEWLTEEDDES